MGFTAPTATKVPPAFDTSAPKWLSGRDGH